MSKHIVIDARIRRTSTGRYVDKLLEYLQPLDSPHRYTVLVEPDDPWQPSADNVARQDCHYAQFSLNPLEQIGFARQLYQLKADVVHFPMNQQPVLYRGTIVTSTLDLTMLTHTHKGAGNMAVFKIKQLGYRLLFWLSNKRSVRIITISRYVQKTLAEKYPFTKDKSRLTYCAVDPPNKLTPQAPKQQPQEFLLYVGRAFPHKNLQFAVEAFGKLKTTSNQALQFVIIGRGDYHQDVLRQWVNQQPFAADVIFTGFIPDEELAWYYQHANAYVFPSVSEGFGLPGLEAMAHGCPVVSSDATCLPEVYGDAALYFDPLDTEDIVAKLLQVINNKTLRKDLVDKGYERIKQFSWQTMAEETLGVYQSVLEKS